MKMGKKWEATWRRRRSRRLPEDGEGAGVCMKKGEKQEAT